MEKYADAAGNLEALRVDCGARVQHGVDATKLAPLTHPKSRWLFDVVSWNFPYPVETASSAHANSQEGAALVAAFLACAGGVLAPGGQVRLLLAPRQGGTTREVAANSANWGVEALAAATGFDLLEVLPFDAAAFPGYEPRREFADSSFPWTGARVHVFGWRPEPGAPPRPVADPPNVIRLDGVDVASRVAADPPRLSSTEQHLGSRLADAADHEPLLRGHDGRSPIVPKGPGGLMTRAALEPLAPRSKTAAVLLAALDSFERFAAATAAAASAAASVPAGSPFDPHVVVAALARVWADSDGDLACSFTPPLLMCGLQCATVCAHERLVRACFPDPAVHVPLLLRGPPPDVMAHVDGLLALAVRDRVAAPAGLRNGVWIGARMQPADVADLASTFFVLARLLHMVDGDDTSVFAVLDAAIEAGVEDARLRTFRAQALSFCLNRMDDGDDAQRRLCADAIVADCDAALALEPINHHVLYTKAFAHRSTPDKAQHARSIPIYEQYLAQTEPDDRMRPAACYHLGLMRLMTHVGGAVPAGDVPPRLLKAARRDYERGLAAEASRLPIFRHLPSRLGCGGCTLRMRVS